MYAEVPAEEVAFAMTLFVSAANGQSSGPSKPARVAQGCEELFLALSFGVRNPPDSMRREALLESSLFRAFCTVWTEYADDPRRVSLCARVLGFYFLMERSRGTILEFWEAPKSSEALVVLHPAVISTVAGVALNENGMLSESAFLERLSRVAEDYPDLQRQRSELSQRGAPEVAGVTWPAGDGEVAGLMRRKDWAQTPVAAAASWPQSLRTAVELTLACGFPMIVLWGPQLLQFYNDAYRDLMGSKHSAGLGQPTRECWPEVWAFNEPIYVKVLAGESITLEDQLFPIVRYGYLEDAYFTLCYSPLRDESGSVSGVLVTVFETTLRARSRLERQRSSPPRGNGGKPHAALHNAVS